MIFSPAVFGSAALLAASQIVSIGPQNAFVIRQGLARQHIVPIILICILSDFLLIGLGVLGMGKLLNAIPGFVGMALLASALLVAWLGLRSLRAALRPAGGLPGGKVADQRSAAIRTILAVTLLNPYVWFDTVVLIGGVSASCLPEARPSFFAGALLASVLWFSLVGGLSTRLAPWFERPNSWRWLDGGVALVMFITAGTMAWRFMLSLAA
ncbi:MULTISPECIES: LysE/ArgO family amino acid transporter [unclassified Paludibacterium]|uniref:LysE/ArgO family amino acid transporter n=1 Tax=unclassified Paludibacterium TaxID=2618429 RepID=UPI00207B933A|nr:LysE family transporter [Paludibacterium sp. B53371]BEV73539.1 LysE/ArgO family amino acid transporter [Paludibacterium sp. THUN1379]